MAWASSHYHWDNIWMHEIKGSWVIFLTDLLLYVVSTLQILVQVNGRSVQSMKLNLFQVLFFVKKTTLWQWRWRSHFHCIGNFGLSALRGSRWIAMETLVTISLYCRKILSHCEKTFGWLKEQLPQNFSTANLRLQILRRIGLTTMERKLRYWHWSSP